jgi:DNA-binding transcriptional LysR family regulator
MGISLLPRIVVGAFPERRRLSIHPLPEKVSKETTWLIWRKGARSPKLDALIEILTPQSAKAAAAKPPRRNNSKIAPGAVRGSTDLRA